MARPQRSGLPRFARHAHATNAGRAESCLEPRQSQGNAIDKSGALTSQWHHIFFHPPAPAFWSGVRNAGRSQSMGPQTGRRADGAVGDSRGAPFTPRHQERMEGLQNRQGCRGLSFWVERKLARRLKRGASARRGQLGGVRGSDVGRKGPRGGGGEARAGGRAGEREGAGEGSGGARGLRGVSGGGRGRLVLD